MIWITILLTAGIFFSVLYLLNFLSKKKKEQSIRQIVKDWFSHKGKHPKIRKLFLSGFLIGSLGLLGFISYNSANRIVYLRTPSGFSEWRNSNGQMYLYVETETNYDLGYLTGHALSYRIAGMKYVLIGLGITEGKNYFDALTLSKQYLPYIPNDYLNELQGLSDGASAGSGLTITLEDILLQSLFFEILYGRHFLNIEGQGCTAFGAVNSDNTTTIGQNIDLYKIQMFFSSFVHFKLGNNPSIFEYRLGACSLPMAKNQAGLMVVVNLVQIIQNAPFCTPIYISVRQGLIQEHRVDSFYNTIFSTNTCSFGLNLIIVNSSDMISVQSLPSNQTVNTLNSSVQTNTYNDIYWQQYLEDPTYSKERQTYAESALNTAYGDNYLTENELITLLGDTPIICRDEGGFLSTATIACITKTKFGLGTTNDNLGSIPI